ncbi:MAG: hypothetical protein ACRDM0_05480 [Thermoleophilaceae bacterium]
MTDELYPWERAGGYPRQDWLKVLSIATQRHVAAAQARSEFLHGGALDLDEWRRLSAADEEAARIYRGVIAGDAEIVGELFGEVLEAEGGPR